MTSYDKILNFIEQNGKISMLDGYKIGVTAISQRANDLDRTPGKYEKYLKGRRIAKREVTGNGKRWVEYYLLRVDRMKISFDGLAIDDQPFYIYAMKRGLRMNQGKL